MARILEQIRETLTNSLSGFTEEVVSSLSAAKKDANKIKPSHFNRNLKYRFEIIENNNGSISRQNDVFTLQLNPQEIDQEEPFAIQVTPTQDGINVEHQGSILKQLTISGTTGIKPRAGAGGVSQNGKFRTASGETGYEQFHKFRNYIRRYAELKKDFNNNSKQLVFQNLKDNEYFIIEPKMFKMKRSKSSRFSYDYNIVFDVVGRLDGTVSTQSLSFLGDLQQASQAASDYLNDAEGIIAGTTELISYVSNDATDLVLNPLRALNQAVLQFRGGKTRVLEIPKRKLIQLRNNTNQLRTNVAASVGIDVDDYNSIQGKTGNTKVIRTEPTISDYRLMNGLNKVIRGINIFLSNDNYFGKKDLLEMSQLALSQFGSSLNIQNTRATRVRKVLKNDDMQKIASRELGSANRFRELIILNNLKYPYIDDTSSNGVLSAGDDILIPIYDTNFENSLVYENELGEYNGDLTFAQLQLGIDLFLNKNYDLSFTNRDDLKLISSHENSAQAAKIKLGLEKGSLRYHPELGVVGTVGDKFTDETAIAIGESMRSSILSDPRFDDADFDITFNATTVSIKGFIKERAFSLSTPIDLTIQR